MMQKEWELYLKFWLEAKMCSENDLNVLRIWGVQVICAINITVRHMVSLGKMFPLVRSMIFIILTFDLFWACGGHLGF